MLQKLSVEDLCNKLRPIFGRKIDDIYFRYVVAETREEKEDIFHILNALYSKNLSKLLEVKILLEPPLKDSVNGDYPLAQVSYAGKKLFPFSLRENDWQRHVCISGMSGSGKTTLAFNVLLNFIENGKPFLVFDWKKSFRPLLLASSDVMCFTIGNESASNLFKMNINKPPKGIDPKEWINILCDLLTESFSASFGVHKCLLETLDEAFEQWGVYNGSGNYPTWNHIKWYLEEKLKKIKGREAGWLESALRIASVLTFGNFGKVCNYKEKDSFDVEDLLDKKVIFELNALSNVEKKFFCEFVLTYIYKLKKARQKSDEGRFEHAILVDEAHNIFLKGSPHFVKESVTDMVYREMREYGTSLICLDQHISKLSDTVKGNSACHIAFQQQLPQDIFDISGITQLMDQKHVFSMLPVGSAIVKLAERYPSPFLIEVSPVKLREKTVSDEEVLNRAKAHIMSIGVEKNVDPEFNRALLNPKPVKVVENYPDRVVFEEEPDKTQLEIISEPEYIYTEPKEQIQEPFKESARKGNLTQAQEILYEYVAKKLKEGEKLQELEDLLEYYRDEGNYTIEDVGIVINYALEQKLKENTILEKRMQIQENPNPHIVTIPERQNIYKEEKPFINSNLDNEQRKFLAFLHANKDNDYGTVDMYRKLGLSSRKGDKIKKELMDKSMIMIQEIKNEKGWKKIIRLAENN